MKEQPEIHNPLHNIPRKPLLVSLYGQKERHVYMQKVILLKQQKALDNTKERPYSATITEKKTEFALLDAHRREKQRIERVYREQNELYNSLDEKLGQEEQFQISVGEDEAKWYLLYFPKIMFCFQKKIQLRCKIVCSGYTFGTIGLL